MEEKGVKEKGVEEKGVKEKGALHCKYIAIIILQFSHITL